MPSPPTERPVVLEWERTCIAMPSQWQGKLADGRIFYGRYRFSNLTLGFGKDLHEAVLSSGDIEGPADHSGGWDGDMSNADFKRWTAEILDWSRAAESPRDDTGWEEPGGFASLG